MELYLICNFSIFMLNIFKIILKIMIIIQKKYFIQNCKYIIKNLMDCRIEASVIHIKFTRDASVKIT